MTLRKKATFRDGIITSNEKNIIFYTENSKNTSKLSLYFIHTRGPWEPPNVHKGHLNFQIIK